VGTRYLRSVENGLGQRGSNALTFAATYVLDPRYTVVAAEQLDVEDLIAEEEVIVTVSHDGYVKRMPIDTYRRQARGGVGVIGSDTKEGDFIEHLFVASTHSYLLIFTSQGRVRKL
jgi:DNA gyrase subunit A